MADHGLQIHSLIEIDEKRKKCLLHLGRIVRSKVPSKKNVDFLRKNKNIQKGPIIDFLPHQSIRLFACDPIIIPLANETNDSQLQIEKTKIKNTQTKTNKN